MELTILGSSSAGNCYIFQNENEALIVECGVRFTDAKKALNFNLRKVAGCLISHEHGDHAKFVNEVLDACIPTFASAGTIENLKIKGQRKPTVIRAKEVFQIGTFRVLPFKTKHDCAEPLGFLINHAETGNVLFATDTYYLPNKFKGLNNILIECNYRMDLLQKNIDDGIVHPALLKRTLQSHLSYETCRDALLANDLSAVNNIVLIHLSGNNSNAREFKQGIEQATGKSVHIATSGMKLNFNKTPF